MKVKPNVRIDSLEPILRCALEDDIEEVFLEHDSLLTITSGHEGDPTDHVHRPDSLHYKKRAVDCRMRHLNLDTMVAIKAGVTRRLGRDFDVILEIADKMGNPRNHLHVEYDPKGATHESNTPPAQLR